MIYLGLSTDRGKRMFMSASEKKLVAVGRISGIVAMNTSNPVSSRIQYAYFSINKTKSLSCSGFTCSDCISVPSCLGQGGRPVGS